MSTKLDEKILASIKLEYPFPLSFTYFSMKNAEEFKAKLDKSIEILESIVKYLTIITLSSFLKNPIEAEQATFILTFLPRPSLGTWNAALREILSYYHTKPEDLFLPEIYHFYFRTNKKPSDNARIMDELIRERNKIAHGGAPATPKDCVQKVEEVQPMLEEILLNLSFLRDYDLLYLKYSKKEQDAFHHAVKICMGAFSQFESKTITMTSSENSNRMYLYHREKNALLDMHPFLIFSDKFEGASSPEIFFYNRIQDDKVNYMNYQSGKSFNDAELYSEMNDVIIEKLKSFSKVKEIKYEEYKRIAQDAWKFGNITPEDEKKLLAKRNELGIPEDVALNLEEEAKNELFTRYITDLIGMLRNAEQKEQSIQTIINSGPRTIPFLVNALSDESIHDGLIEILVSFKEEALKSLIVGLYDEKTRSGVIKALKAMPATSLPMLLKELNKEEEIPEIEETLISFGDIAVNSLIEIIRIREKKAQEGGLKIVSLKEDRIWIRAKRVLTNIGKPAARAVVSCLSDELLQETASQIITDIGEDSYEALIKALSDNMLSEKALEILKEFGTSTIPLLLEETSQNNALEHITEEFILSFGTAALPFLVKALRYGTMRELSIKLIERYPETYSSEIIPLLSDPSLYEISEQLLIKAGTHAVNPLVRSLGDGSIGDHVEKMLEKLPPKDVMNCLLEEVKTRGKSFLSTISISGKIESGVRDVLKDISKSKILGAVLDSVKLSPDKIQASLKNIRDPFAQKSISLISKMPPEELYPLIDLLENDQLFDFLRLSLMTSGEKTIPIILKTLPEKSNKICERCAIILSDIGVQAVPYLIEAINDDKKKPTAMKALIAIGSDAAGELAKALIDEELRESIKNILLGIGSAGYKEFSQYLGVPIIGEILEEIILDMKDDIIPYLIESLNDVSLRSHCIRILNKLGNRATEYLVDGLKKEETASFVIEILKNTSPSTVYLLFEKYKSGSVGVASILKSIISFGKKQDTTVLSLVRRAILEISVLYPGPLLEICVLPKNREIALPLLAETILHLISDESIKKRDENISLIREFIKSNNLEGSIKPLLESNKSFRGTVTTKAISIMEI